MTEDNMIVIAVCFVAAIIGYIVGDHFGAMNHDMTERKSRGDWGNH